jgi:hypothetical protein
LLSLAGCSLPVAAYLQVQVLWRSAPDAHFRGSLDVAVDPQQDALELVADFFLEK